jgi:protein-S-isoprenylcysteine O-methyltransferase Ste14
MSARLAIIGTATTLVQLGLVILIEGGFDAFFSHPPLVALAVLLVILLIVSLFSPANLSSGEREDRANRWVFVAFGLLAVLLAVAPAYTDRIGFWTIDGDATRWAGVALVAIGFALRLWPVFVLGHRFSGLVAIQPGHQLVTNGIYTIIRNPSYLGLLIGAVGWALAFRSAVGIILALLNLVPLVARMNSEEALLRSQFGTEYEAYYRRTWRLIPWLY